MHRFNGPLSPHFRPACRVVADNRRSSFLSHPRPLRGLIYGQPLPIPGQSIARPLETKKDKKTVARRASQADTRRVRFSPLPTDASGKTARQYKRSCIYKTTRPLRRNVVTWSRQNLLARSPLTFAPLIHGLN